MGKTMVFLSIMGAQEEQKALMHDLFADADWEASRVLAGMDQVDDFYMQSNAQVKLNSWSKGLIRDARYCPSPISGMGTAEWARPSLSLACASLLARSRSVELITKRLLRDMKDS